MPNERIMTIHHPRVCWITGLSGAGKSTLATKVTRILRDRGQTIIILDGDELRKIFGVTGKTSQHYGEASRLKLAMQYANLCHVMSSQGVTVVMDNHISISRSAQM